MLPYRKNENIAATFHFSCVKKSINPKSGQHLISPYSYTAESFTTIMTIKDMIADLRSFDC